MAAVMGDPTLAAEEDGRRRVTEEGPEAPPLVVGFRDFRPSPDDGRCRGCGCRAQEGGGDDADAACRRDLVVDAAPQHHLTTMLEEKRLVLVLDLDHTLLHSIGVHRLTPREAYLLRPEPPRPRPLLDRGRHPPPSTMAAAPGGRGGDGRRGGGGGHSPMLFNLTETLGCITKLRPFVHTFLREANAMYHLCICTMGDHTYAHEMARLLDPDGAYFAPGDIVSRSDYTEQDKKGLDVVRRGDERTTVIVDDTADVWEKDRDNLIHVPEYHYFAGTKRSLGFTAPSWAEMRRDEDELAGALAGALHILRQTHRAFFDPDAGGGGVPATRDVRNILRGLIKKKQGGTPVAGAARWLRPPQQAQVQRHRLQTCRI